jgi:hypothetical protein
MSFAFKVSMFLSKSKFTKKVAAKKRIMKLKRCRVMERRRGGQPYNAYDARVLMHKFYCLDTRRAQRQSQFIRSELLRILWELVDTVALVGTQSYSRPFYQNTAMDYLCCTHPLVRASL